MISNYRMKSVSAVYSIEMYSLPKSKKWLSNKLYHMSFISCQQWNYVYNILPTNDGSDL